MNTIGAAINLARKNLGLTEDDLAERVGLTSGDVVRVEQGDDLSLQIAQNIAKALGFRFSQLVIIAESLLKPEDEIKEFQRELLLSIQPILARG